MRAFVHFKKYWIAGAAILAIALIFIFNTGRDLPEGIEVAPVTRSEVVEVVSETGYVLPAQSVELAFKESGRLVEMLRHEGELVAEGEAIMRIDGAEQAANLSAARARLAAEEVRLSELRVGADDPSKNVLLAAVDAAKTSLLNAERNLRDVTLQQGQLVENAAQSLRSTDLQAYLIGSDTGSSRVYDPPTISGTYTHGEEGVYRLELYNSNSQSGASFNLSGLEEGTQAISTDAPVPLGTRGLYIQFPEDFARNTVWEVPIPNTRSSQYVANQNAFNAAQNTKTVALTSAENAVEAAKAAVKESELQYIQSSGGARDERLLAQVAVVAQMRAAVDAAMVAYENTVLRAPFNGVVSDVYAEIGELVSGAAPALSLISTDAFELTVYVSESDFEEVTVGDSATVRLDAFDDREFEATVTRIAPSATVVDGVRVFEVRLQFTEANSLIRSGISADIDIRAASRPGVIAVPSRAVVEREDGKYLRALRDGELTYIKVTTGLRGSDGKTEIIEGVNEGEEIITFASSDALKQLESE